MLSYNKWEVTNFLLSFFIVGGILTKWNHYIPIILFFFYLVVKKYKPKKEMLLIGYITGIIVATKQENINKAQKKILERESKILGKVACISKTHLCKFKLIIKKINEPLNIHIINENFFTNKKIACDDKIKFCLKRNRYEINYPGYINKEKKTQKKTMGIFEDQLNKYLSQKNASTCNKIFTGSSSSGNIKNDLLNEEHGNNHMLARSGLHLSPLKEIISLNCLAVNLPLIYYIYKFQESTFKSYSYLRALIILFLIALSIMLDRKKNNKILFTYSCIFIICVYPESIFYPSTQLTFALTAGLYFLI